MAGFQVTARRQVDDTILMVPTYRKLDTKELIHRVVKPLDDDISLVVWWPERLDPALEDLTIVFMPAGYGMDLIIAWDNVKAILPVKL